jgi:hypothetical protein
MNLKKKFSVIFFLFILYYYLPFLDGNKKKTLHDIFAFNNNRPQIEHITQKKIQNAKKKNKSKCEGPTNKSTKIPKYFWNFLISKRGSFG